MTEFIDEIPRYRKKARKKSGPKANHKHRYENCVFSFFGIHLERNNGFVKDADLSYSIGTFCPICGRIGTDCDRSWEKNIGYTPSKENWRDKWTNRALSEFDPLTRTIPHFFLEDRWQQKYVKLNETTSSVSEA